MHCRVLIRLDDHVDLDNNEDFPLAPYAAEYWPRHAKFRSVSARIKDGMECLFDDDKPHFATWLWIYKGTSAMCPEKPGAVPLYLAARLGFHDLAAHLIAEHPEHVNARDDWDNLEETVMHAATKGGNHDTLSLLLDQLNTTQMSIAGMGDDAISLHWASYRGTLVLSVGQYLLYHVADINARHNIGLTPLFDAARQGHVSLLKCHLNTGQ
jgi:ankyrin repeat protein